MRYMRTIRNQKGITIGKLALETGISKATIWKHEVGRSKMQQPLIEKIAKFFDTTVEELNKKIVKESEITKTKPCLNEVCPLNKNKKCINDVILSGRAPCHGKDKIQSKRVQINYKDTSSLFIK